MRRVSTPVLLWAGVVAILGAGGVAGASAVVGVMEGEEPAEAEAGPGAGTGAGTAADPDTVDLAGSGSNLPLTRALVDAFSRRDPGVHLVVHESIGSSGGVRAASDGAVEIGLISRPLRDRERALGLTVVPYARVPVVFAVHPSVRDEGITRAEILDVYSGRKTRWRDGSPIVPLLRERGDSGHAAVARVIPEFARVSEAAWRDGRWRVLFHDREMQEALLGTAGAIGPFDLGAIVSQRLALRALAVDGLVPTDPRYPFEKELAFVHRRDLSPAAAAFLRFATSPEAAAIAAELGYRGATR